jgi:hypothetical protein
MQFSPRLDQAPVTLRQCARDKLHGIDTENSDFLLVISVKVRRVMLRADLGKHSDNYAEEATQFRHDLAFYFRDCSRPIFCPPNGLTFSRKPREPTFSVSNHRGVRLGGCNVLIPIEASPKRAW